MRIPLRRGWLLRLDDGDGRQAFGECAPLPSHGTESSEAAAAALRECCRRLPGMTPATALAGLDELAAGKAGRTPAVRAAVETALLDLLAQTAGMPLWRYLAATAGNGRIRVNALPGDALGVAGMRIEAVLAAGFTTIKLKLGSGDSDGELAALRRLATQLPAHVRLRLDANRSWTAETAERICRALAGLPVESLEEPLANPTPEALRSLQRQLPYALAVDESWHTLDADAFFADPPVRRLVLKLACQGGPSSALATARRARAAGVDCVVTTGIDSACGTLAAAHLAAAIDNGLAHGLATSDWLAADTGRAPRIADGHLCLSERPGLGFEKLPE